MLGVLMFLAGVPLAGAPGGSRRICIKTRPAGRTDCSQRQFFKQIHVLISPCSEHPTVSYGLLVSGPKLVDLRSTDAWRPVEFDRPRLTVPVVPTISPGDLTQAHLVAIPSASNSIPYCWPLER